MKPDYAFEPWEVPFQPEPLPEFCSVCGEVELLEYAERERGLCPDCYYAERMIEIAMENNRQAVMQ